MRFREVASIFVHQILFTRCILPSHDQKTVLLIYQCMLSSTKRLSLLLADWIHDNFQDVPDVNADKSDSFLEEQEIKQLLDGLASNQPKAVSSQFDNLAVHYIDELLGFKKYKQAVSILVYLVEKDKMTVQLLSKVCLFFSF